MTKCNKSFAQLRNLSWDHGRSVLAVRRVLAVGLMVFISASLSWASDESAAEGTIVAVNETDSPNFDKTEFSLRRRSTVELWRDRDQYRDAVIQGLRSQDLETNERARWVVERWQRGIFVDTPPDVAERLAAMDPAEAIELLLELGDFASATLALEEAVGTLEYEGMASRIGMTLNVRFPIYARQAIQQNTEDDLLDFLAKTITSKELAVCHHDWNRLLGGSDDEPQRPVSFQSNPDAAEQVRCLLALLDGDQEKALQIAIRADQVKADRVPEVTAPNQQSALDLESTRMPLTRLVRMVSGQWQAMANESAEAALAIDAKSDQDRPEAIRWWSDALICAFRCGDEKLQSKAIAGLVPRSPVAPSLQSADAQLAADVRSLAWRTLLIHGQVDAAIQWVSMTDPGDAAAVAVSASRPADAMRPMGFSWEDVDTRLDQKIDLAIAAQRQLYADMTSSDFDVVTAASIKYPSGITQEVESLFSMIRVLLSVGRDDAAWRIADRLSIDEFWCKRGGRSQKYLVRDYVLLSLMLTNKTDWIIRLAFRDWETDPTEVSQGLVARVLTISDPLVLPVVSELIRMQSTHRSPKEVFRLACEIARADEADRKNHADWMPILFQALRNGSLRRQLSKASPAQGRMRESILQQDADVWSDLFLAYGRPDLAEPHLRAQAATGDLESMLTLAQDYRLSNDLPDETLDQTLETIWDLVAEPANEPRSQYRDEVSTGIQAVAAQAKLAKDQGDQHRADRLIAELNAMACTPSTDIRQLIADELADLGMWQNAERIYRSLLYMTALSSDETQSLIDIAKNFQNFAFQATQTKMDVTESAIAVEDPQPEKNRDLRLRRMASQWLDLAFAGTLSAFEYRPQLYLIYPRLIAREQLELAIADREAVPPEDRSSQDDEIERLLNHLQRLDRLDITTAESILPKLRQVGMRETADRFMANLLDAADEHFDLFSADAMIANNVAWAAAVNESSLPQALELARRAVRIEPDSAIYRDTLAEILARLDRPGEALLIEKGCVIDDPGQWHLHEQVQRFKNLVK